MIILATAGDPAEEGRIYKWEIEPHPYSPEFDTYMTDDDQDALEAARQALENLWDDMNPGDDVMVIIKMREPSQANPKVKQGD